MLLDQSDIFDIEPGSIIAAKYRVDGVLGRGGMGVVVAATHVALDTRVAVKLLLPTGVGQLEATERFSREARAAVRLRSEHAARIFDVGQMSNGTPYIVMELLEGIDLATHLKSGALGVSEAVDYVLQASEAVAEAHALGIIHRDLKPRNLFLARTVHGEPLIKVLDFGISKLTGPALADDELALTRESVIMGSPNYMSPEQLDGPRDVDARTDVWSLGVILYELLTHALPFKGATLPEICARVFHDDPEPLEKLRPEVPLALAAVVMHALAKTRDVRIQSVQDLARDLAPFASDASIADKVLKVRVEARAPATRAARASFASVPSFQQDDTVAEKHGAAAGAPAAPGNVEARPGPPEFAATVAGPAKVRAAAVAAVAVAEQAKAAELAERSLRGNMATSISKGQRASSIRPLVLASVVLLSVISLSLLVDSNRVDRPAAARESVEPAVTVAAPATESAMAPATSVATAMPSSLAPTGVDTKAASAASGASAASTATEDASAFAGSSRLPLSPGPNGASPRRPRIHGNGSSDDDDNPAGARR